MANSPAKRRLLEDPPPGGAQRIRHGPGEFDFGDLRLPALDPPHAVVILIHGGFWRATYDLEYMGHAADRLTAAGWATWNIEYRRVGHNGRGYSGMLDDVARASEHVASIPGLDVSRVVAAGHSAGGHLALWLATSKRGVRLCGAVSLAGVADLGGAWELGLGNGAVGEFIGGSPRDVPERFQAASPIQNLPCHTPTRLIHGDADESVPVEIAARFEAVAVAAGDDSRLIRMAGAGHFEPVDPDAREWPIVESTIGELLS